MTALDLSTTFLDLADGGAVHAHVADETFWPRLMAGGIAMDRFAGVTVPRGVRRRTVVHEPARALFVTRGDGTDHRPVEEGETGT